MADYRLQALLMLREQAKDEAEQAFAAAQIVLKEEQDKLSAMQEELAGREAERKAKVEAFMSNLFGQGGGQAGALSGLSAFENRLKDEEIALKLDIDAQEAVIKQAEREVARCRAEMLHAAQELKALEKHKEAWALERKQERERREELSVEEIGNALHQAKGRKLG